MLRRSWPSRRRARTGPSVDRPRDVDEVGVEETETERDAHAREQPEAHDHGELRPTADFEVMVDGRHAEYPPVEAAERDDLRDDAERLDDVEPAQDRQQEHHVRYEREPGDPPADGERAGVSHEDARRCRVPPEEAATRTGERPGN